MVVEKTTEQQTAKRHTDGGAAGVGGAGRRAGHKKGLWPSPQPAFLEGVPVALAAG